MNESTIVDVLGAREIRTVLRRILTLRDKAKACYDEADELEARLRAQLSVGSVVALTSGKRYELRDNFALRNVVFRAHGIRRFEFVELKDSE